MFKRKEEIIYIFSIQGVSGGICVTLGNDSMSDSKQKSSYEHGSDFERLRSYGYFLIPVHALVWTELRNQLAGDELNLVAYRLRCKHYFWHLTHPPSYRQSSFRISTLGRYLRNAEKVGWVAIRLASLLYTAWLSYYYVFENPYHLHCSECAGSWCSEQYGDSFVKAWAVEATV